MAVALATMFISVYPVNYIKELNVIEAILSPSTGQRQLTTSTKQSLIGDNRRARNAGESQSDNNLSTYDT